MKRIAAALGVGAIAAAAMAVPTAQAMPTDFKASSGGLAKTGV